MASMAMYQASQDRGSLSLDGIGAEGFLCFQCISGRMVMGMIMV